MKTNYIFIVGNSRSGTTMLAEMLRQHSKVYILNETHFFEEYIHKNWDLKTPKGRRSLINQMLCIEKHGVYRKNINKDYSDEANVVISGISEHENNIYSIVAKVFNHIAQRKGKVIAGDQTPRNIFYLDTILQEFSGSKALIMVRDSRDVILSQKSKWKAIGKIGLPRFEVLRTKLNYHPIIASFIWKQGIKTALKFKNNRYSQNVRFIIFEDLLLNPNKVVHEITDFLGIDFEDKMFDIPISISSNLEENTQRLRGVIPSVAGKWKENLNKTEAYLCQQITRCQLKYFEYDIEQIKPNYILLLVYLITFLPRLTVATCLNLNRIGNPFRSIMNRILITFRPIKLNEK